MKVKNFDKLVALHLGALYDAANDNSEKVTPFHRLLLSTPDMDEETIHKFATKTLSDKLKPEAITDPAEASYSSMGFAPFSEEVGNTFALSIPGTKAIVLQVEKRERVLPGVSVRNAVVERMKALQAKEIDGWTPTRKDWAELKEDVEANMLKTAPIRPSKIFIMLSMPYVFVFTSSAKNAEACTAMLRKAVGTFPTESLLIDEYSLRQFMKGVVAKKYSDYEPDHYVHVKHEDGDDVKVKDIDIGNCTMVNDLLDNDYTPRALDFSVDTQTIGIDRVWLRLTDKAIVSGLHIGEADVDANYDATLEHYGTDGGLFLSMMANLFQLDKSLHALFRSLDETGEIVVEYTATLEDDDEV
jgi:DNA recombination-dependent growth factor C